MAELLIAKDADVNVQVDGTTPLHIAAEAGHIALVKLLITKGANVDARTKDGETALRLAQDEGHKEIVEFLRKHGAKE